MKPYILGAIFARGGSKSIPRKNIKIFNGKPLIAYAIETAKKVRLIDRLIVSTNDDEIATVARRFGADVPFMRPGRLATDKAPEILSWRHAIRTMEKKLGHQVDILVSVPATAPLRAVEDVEKCVEKIINTDADIVVTVKEATRSPYFNMVLFDQFDNARLVVSLGKVVSRRQDAPKAYDMATVAYAVRRAFVMKAGFIFEGKVKAVEIPQERALDIDTIMDFEIAEFLIKKRRKRK
ncbi:MAG: acylneuraminate cytidylyltransferase family protein [Candidatus Omnitrophota bacterium]